MSAVTKETIISKAKSLVGTDEGNGCDIMKWYGGFSTAINNVACCCAGVMLNIIIVRNRIGCN